MRTDYQDKRAPSPPLAAYAPAKMGLNFGRVHLAIIEGVIAVLVFRDSCTNTSTVLYVYSTTAG